MTTVKDLIEYLCKFPTDAIVRVGYTAPKFDYLADYGDVDRNFTIVRDFTSEHHKGHDFYGKVVVDLNA